MEQRQDETTWFYQQAASKNKARAYINNIDEAILECYRVFAKQIKPLSSEPQNTNFSHLSKDQKNALYIDDMQKLKDVYYQPDNFRTGSVGIRQPLKIMCISKKDVSSWLANHTFWQVFIPLHKVINHPHYDVTRTNELLKLDLVYVPHNIFERNIYKYILTGIDVVSRHKVTTVL